MIPRRHPVKRGPAWLLVLGALAFLLVGSLAACAEPALPDPGRPGPEEPQPDPEPPPDPVVRVVTGEFWALPERYPAKSPYGGLYQMWSSAGGDVFAGLIGDVVMVGPRWRDFEPRDDEVAWDRLEQGTGIWYPGIAQVHAAGKRALLWITYFHYNDKPWGRFYDAPSWVFDKCEAAGEPISIIRNADGSPYALAIWEDCPRRELLQFIGRLSRYRDDPRVAYAYITLFAYGEFHMTGDPHRVNDAIDKGLTGEVLRSFCQDVIDAWVGALGRRKVIWPGHKAWGPSRAGFKSATAWCNDYALNVAGTNVREGLGESISSAVENPLLGQTVEEADGRAYMRARTVHEIGRDGVSFYGDEYEEERRGRVFSDYDYFRMGVLNMLRAGKNYAVFPNDLLDPAKDDQHPRFAVLRDYFRASAGYPVEEAPDAWAVLLGWAHEARCFGPDRRRELQNYEKFLVQREVDPDGRTVLTERKDYPKDAFGFCRLDGYPQNHVYRARRTDLASGSRYIYFDLDDRFLPPGPQKVRIAVHFRDEGSARWRLEYNAPDDAYRRTPEVPTRGDGAWKTALFDVHDFAPRGAQAGGLDLRIANDGDGDLTVGWVRVIRLADEPGPGATASTRLRGAGR
jgi:hypothetical protein